MAREVRSEVFERMRESYALVTELGLPSIKSEYWSDLLSKGRQDYGGKGEFIERDDLWLGFRNNVITKGLDNANVPEEALERVHAKWRSIYERLSGLIPECFRPYLEESPVGNPRGVEIDGIQVTQSSLEYTYMLTHLDGYLDGVEVVVDIGGGYGGLARLIKLSRPEVRVVLVDLPEVNAIQTYFLSCAFPDESVLGLTDVETLEAIDAREVGADFLILPGPLMEKLRPSSFELVINTRSMMEMDLATVSFYLGQVQSKLPENGVFYTVNRYEKKTRLKDYPFDDRWFVSYSRPWPTFIDENPHHELAAVRTRLPVVEGVKEHLQRLPPYDGVADRMRAWVDRRWS
ncbi:MAG: hypothetical protein BMS9Abin37_2917 [Acidobacteriota bacterium]|nr:MAG: hypothetical protein BMS9Abin37_2917 [Acidobacteriota bacterium]